MRDSLGHALSLIIDEILLNNRFELIPALGTALNVIVDDNKVHGITEILHYLNPKEVVAFKKLFNMLCEEHWDEVIWVPEVESNNNNYSSLAYLLTRFRGIPEIQEALGNLVIEKNKTIVNPNRTWSSLAENLELSEEFVLGAFGKIDASSLASEDMQSWKIKLWLPRLPADHAEPLGNQMDRTTDPETVRQWFSEQPRLRNLMAQISSSVYPEAFKNAEAFTGNRLDLDEEDPGYENYVAADRSQRSGSESFQMFGQAYKESNPFGAVRLISLMRMAELTDDPAQRQAYLRERITLLLKNECFDMAVKIVKGLHGELLVSADTNTEDLIEMQKLAIQLLPYNQKAELDPEAIAIGGKEVGYSSTVPIGTADLRDCNCVILHDKKSKKTALVHINQNTTVEHINFALSPVSEIANAQL